MLNWNYTHINFLIILSNIWIPITLISFIFLVLFPELMTLSLVMIAVGDIFVYLVCLLFKYQLNGTSLLYKASNIKAVSITSLKYFTLWLYGLKFYTCEIYGEADQKIFITFDELDSEEEWIKLRYIKDNVVIGKNFN